MTNTLSVISIYGSVIPRTVPMALFGGLESALLKWASMNYPEFWLFKQ